MNEDNRDFFLDEARDLVSSLETSLLKLERTPDATFAIHDIFRVLHTIKGSGAMFGFDAVSKFAHQLENLFDDIRKGLFTVNQETIAIGLRSVDCFSKLIEENRSFPESDRIVGEIARMRGRHGKSPEPPDGRESGSEEKKEYPYHYDIAIRPSPTALFRGIKFEVLFSTLEKSGTFKNTADAARVPDIFSIRPEEVYLSWNIALDTRKTRAEIEEEFIFVRECAECDIAGDPGETAQDAPKQEKNAIQPEPAHAPAQPREHRADPGYIRVKREKLDFLVDTVGELVILQAQLMRESSASGMQAFKNIAEQLERLSVTIRDATMYMRMVPIEEAFAGLQRVVHDTAKRLGKEVRLEVIGANTEIDKNIAETLKDPLIHLIRNSLDHGIETPQLRAQRNKPETGTITISACQIGTSVQIVVADDGNGLNIEKIRARAVEKKLISPDETDTGKIIPVIFEAGFSTAEKTTSISGRGVGMDIVRTSIDKLQGDIAIATESCRGTAFTLTVPLTLMITDGILVSIGGVMYVLTLNLVQECLLFDNCVRDGLVQHDAVNYHDRTYPIVDLNQYICGTHAPVTGETRAILTTVEGNEIAIVAEKIAGKQQVVIKPFSTSLEQIPVVSGATILADGSVALILNMSELVKRRIPAFCDF